MRDRAIILMFGIMMLFVCLAQSCVQPTAAHSAGFIGLGVIILVFTIMYMSFWG